MTVQDLFDKGGPFHGVDPEKVDLMAQFTLITCGYTENGDRKSRVAVLPTPGPDGSEPPFEAWMTACEYFISCVARRSGAGYEKAIELLTQGAMKFRTPTSGKVSKPPSEAPEG